MATVAPDETVLRPLTSHEDYLACVELQRLTWGERFTECVPPSVLMISQKVGGVAAGAFDRAGRLIGFVYGITGTKHGRLVHWSHMLAVRREAQGLGLGKRLKLYQREQLLPLGVEDVYWTYDPLVARNANLNFNFLGVRVAEYVPDLYGPDTESELHSGIGTDRFVVVWRITAPEVAATIRGERSVPPPAPDAPVVNVQLGPGAASVPRELPLPDAREVRVEIPPDIHLILARSREDAWPWRITTRRAILRYLGRGYRVDRFYMDQESGRAFYVLAASAAP